jgi:signal peptidase
MKTKWKEGVFGTLDALGIFALVILMLIAYGCTNNRWYRVLIVRSGSMTPVFHTGDLILISRPSGEVLDPGTIITFRVGDKIVTHRIVDLEQGGYITKGDANNTIDYWNVDVNTSGLTQIIGVYRGKIPYLGFAASWLFQLPQSMDDWMSTRAEFSDSMMFMERFQSGRWITPEPPAPADPEWIIEAEVPEEPSPAFGE